jgi:hypothetical protein
MFIRSENGNLMSRKCGETVSSTHNISECPAQKEYTGWPYPNIMMEGLNVNVSKQLSAIGKLSSPSQRSRLAIKFDILSLRWWRRELQLGGKMTPKNPCHAECLTAFIPPNLSSPSIGKSPRILTSNYHYDYITGRNTSRGPPKIQKGNTAINSL